MSKILFLSDGFNGFKISFVVPSEAVVVFAICGFKDSDTGIVKTSILAEFTDVVA